jgi:Putative zinc-finger
MSIFSCGEVRELAPELALGVLGGAERAEAIMHVNECARCQALVLELTEVADALPLLAPELEPPAGFEHRVLSQIHTRRRWNRRRFVPTIAAVAAAVAILSVTAVRVIEANNSASTAPRAAAARAPIAVEMRDNAAGVPAGWAYVTGGHSVAVTVDYGVSSGRYDVQLTPARGGAESLGTITVEGNRGSWTGRSARTITRGSTLALVDAAGRAVCHGTVTALA